MDVNLVNIGFGNIIAANRVIAVVSPESAPIKRIIQEARERGMLIDATYGRPAIQPETVSHRLEDDK
jgi:hypothetical protein